MKDELLFFVYFVSNLLRNIVEGANEPPDGDPEVDSDLPVKVGARQALMDPGHLVRSINQSIDKSKNN